MVPFFYRHWHGGLSYNMRYFLPLLPLIAVMAALCWAEVARHVNFEKRHGFTWLKWIAVGTGIGVVILFNEVLAGSAAAIDLALYGSLGLAGLMFTSSVLFIACAGSVRMRAAWATLVLSTVGFVWAGASAVSHDFVLDQVQRIRVAADIEEAASLDPRALVFTTSAQRLLPQFQRTESFVAMVFDGIDPKERRLVEHHVAAGRRVYVRNRALAEELVGAFGDPAYRIVAVGGGESQFVELLPPESVP
jgi:hypothetical protein